VALLKKRKKNGRRKHKEKEIERRNQKMHRRFYMIVLVSILLPVLGLSYNCIPRAHAELPADLEIPPGTIPPYYNLNISVFNLPPQAGVTNYLSAYVYNLGPNDASGVSVAFFIGQLGAMSANGPGWQYVGTSAQFTVSKNSGYWSPPVTWIPAESGHHCAQAVVNYTSDPNPNNNKAQRNLDIQPWPTGEKILEVTFNVWAPEFNKPFTVNLTFTTSNLPPGAIVSLPQSVDTPINGSTHATLSISNPSGQPTASFNVTVTATYQNGTAYGGFLEEVTIPIVGVGGIVVPVDKLGLLAPYVGFASTILVGAVASTVYVKRVKRRKEKQ
jgi:hypothetical protein